VIKVTWDHGFKKLYKKKIKSNEGLRKRFWNSMGLFSRNPFDARLRTHKLTGKLEGLWAFSVDYDWRVIFKFLKEDEILLIDVGGHDEVY
jgi:addiction module RelE/StbE family toxin